MTRREFRIIGYFFIMASFFSYGLAAYQISVLLTNGWDEAVFTNAIVSLFGGILSFRIALVMFRQAQNK